METRITNRFAGGKRLFPVWKSRVLRGYPENNPKNSPVLRLLVYQM
jgi:hypothetical protein